jgi:DNA polymerase III subunit alpha
MFLARSNSHHSLLCAIPKIKALIEDAKKKGYTSLVLSDNDTTSGLVEFYEECGYAEFKGILGVTLSVLNPDESIETANTETSFSRVSFVAKNDAGYKTLLKLTSLAKTEKEEPIPHITLQDIATLDAEKNLYYILSNPDNQMYKQIISGHSVKKSLENWVKHLSSTNLLVEAIFPTKSVPQKDAKKLNLELVKACDELGTRLIVSPAPKFLHEDQEEVFRVIEAIKAQVKLFTINSERSLHLYTVDELKNMFDYLPQKVFETQDIEDGISVTIRTDYDKHADEAFFPNFEIPSGQGYAQRLVWETYINFLDKYDVDDIQREGYMLRWPFEKLEELKVYARTITPSAEKIKYYDPGYWDETKISEIIKEYVDRLDYELDIIIQKGFPSYFLVFADIMQFCRDNGIVASTRGSAAGSLVGYINNINIIDPLVYKLPFERFLNPMRPSAPDIDGDFADDRRDEVIQYIRRKYGDDKVTQIITFGTMLPRAAVRDVGRVLGVSYKKCDTLSKLIPNAPQGKKTTFEWAMTTSEEFKQAYETDDEVKRVVDIAKVVEGNYRHASSHAAGVIISPTPMVDYAAVQWDSDHKMKIVQYDMKIIEKVGLIKLDILGITNLAILGNSIDLAKQRRGVDIDLVNIDVHDKKAFQLLARGRTMGVFQLAGAAMTKYLVELEPTKVQDLQAMVALYRPGPMGNIPDYISRKKNPKKVKYFFKEQEEFMKDSYGVLVYQDDLLYTVINIAGYDWGEVDVFRKGVGKKIQAVIDSQHERFVDGAIKHRGIDREKAEEYWQIIVPFAAYGFNKAHASNYGMVAYWTAYMKAEYTAEFMTALMTSESNNLDKVATAIKESYELGLAVLPPDINKSFEGFTIDDDTTIRYGLDSVKNLGKDVVRYMIEERKASGPFSDMGNFVERMSQCKGFNKRSVEALIWSGALDEVGAVVLG